MSDFNALDALLIAAMKRGDGEQAARLEAAQDLLDKPGPERLVLNSALWYASAGWPVFPLAPGSKIPLPGSAGLLDATTDPFEVALAFQFPGGDRNIGLATGHGHDVIDIDGDIGHASIVDALLVEPDFVPTVEAVSVTPHGMHLWIKPTGRRNTVGILSGVDYRGMGGYVVAPPSVVDGSTYRWVLPPYYPKGTS